MVTVEGPGRRLESTAAVVALTVENGRVGIVGVGENEEELSERLSKRIEGGIGATVAAKILETARRKMDPIDNREPLRLLQPGEDPWWDEKWKDPYSLKKGDESRARNPKEVLVVRPLAVESWSPHLVRGLLMYVLWTSAWTRGKTWPAFRRPRVRLTADGIEGSDYAELVDQLRSLWGTQRVELPADRPVDPPPPTPLRRAYRASRVVWWLSLGATLILARLASGGSPSSASLAAAAVAAVALMVSRVLRARTEVERPRVRGRGAPEPG